MIKRKHLGLIVVAVIGVGIVAFLYNYKEARDADNPAPEIPMPITKYLPVEAKTGEEGSSLLAQKLVSPSKEEESSTNDIHPMYAELTAQLESIQTMKPQSQDVQHKMTPEQQQLFNNTVVHFQGLSQPEYTDVNSERSKEVERKLFELSKRRYEELNSPAK